MFNRQIAPPLWLFIFVALVCTLQWYIPYPIDDDTAYHFSVSRLLVKHGILQAFPWTRFSWQFDHYADKEFLFHILFIPFSGFDFVTASRIVGVIGGSLILSTIYLVLSAERVRNAGLWALLPLGTSIFVYRFAQVRPHLFSITLAILLLWAYSRRKPWVLGAVGFLYPLTYVAFWQIPLILAIAAETARHFAGERFCRKSCVILMAGIAAGILFHPNASNLLAISWIHMTDILLHNAWGSRVEFNMGEEFDPFTLHEWLQYLTIAALMAGSSLIGAWRNRKEDSFAFAIALTTMFFWLLTIRTNRFLEYFVPFAVLASGLTSRWFKVRYLAPTLLIVSLLYTVTLGMIPYRNLRSFDLKNWYMEPAVVEVLDRQIPVGANVFTTGWEYTGSLLLNLPDRYYMVALDPTLLYKRDPVLYNQWYRTLLDTPADSVQIVRTTFNSRYIIAQNYQPLWPFFDALVKDPAVRLLFANQKWIFFDLGESAAAQKQ